MVGFSLAAPSNHPKKGDLSHIQFFRSTLGHATTGLLAGSQAVMRDCHLAEPNSEVKTCGGKLIVTWGPFGGGSCLPTTCEVPTLKNHSRESALGRAKRLATPGLLLTRHFHHARNVSHAFGRLSRQFQVSARHTGSLFRRAKPDFSKQAPNRVPLSMSEQKQSRINRGNKEVMLQPHHAHTHTHTHTHFETVRMPMPAWLRIHLSASAVTKRNCFERIKVSDPCFGPQ